MSPTIRQRELGLRLRKLRTGCGCTVEEVAEKLMCSPAEISRLETRARMPVLRDVRDLCSLYGVAEPEAEDLMKLAREARQQGWWTRYEDLSLSPYIGLEQESFPITDFAMYYIHALVQTEEYAHAILKESRPRWIPPLSE